MSAAQQEKEPRFQVGDRLVLANNNPKGVLVAERENGLRPVGLPAIVVDVYGPDYYGCVIEGVPVRPGGVYQFVRLEDLSKPDTLIRRYKPGRRIRIAVKHPHYDAWDGRDVGGKQGHIVEATEDMYGDSESRTGLDVVVRLDDYNWYDQIIIPEDIDFI